MIEMMIICPASADIMLLNPATMKRIPMEGQRVPRDAYWLRRITDGDAIEVTDGGLVSEVAYMDPEKPKTKK